MTDDDRSDELLDWYAEDSLDDDGPVQHSGHLGMAYKLADRFTGKLLYVYGLGWHRWEDGRWRHTENGAGRRAVHTIIKRERAAIEKLPAEKREKAGREIARHETATAISGILTEAGALTPFATTVDEIDTDPWLINCANGTLDLRDVQLRAHDPADRITKICRGAYQPDTRAPVWDEFLARVLPDEQVRGFVQRLAGLALLGEVREHVLPILTGQGRNGKGTLYKALLYAFGDYAAPAEPDLFMHREGAHPTGQMDLLSRRLVVVSENDKGRKLAEATMKRLTGGDPIKARAMRQDFVEFQPSHLPILVTNHLPRVSGDDPAVWARIRVIPFDVVIPDAEQDKHLDAKLQLEADGILAWAVEGWRDYQERGGLAEPDSVRIATDNYQLDSDPVGRFIDECCDTGAMFSATTKPLYEKWQRWQESDGTAEPMGRRTFGEALDRRGYPAEPPSCGQRIRRGIAVKQDSGEPTDGD